MSHILKCHINIRDGDSRVEQLISCCKRIGCEKILLFTSSYDGQVSFQLLEEYEAYAEKLKKWMEKFKNEGIHTGINVIQTLGHIYHPRSLSKIFPFQRKVDIKGEESLSGVCPLCCEFREYIKKVYRIFAGLKPDIIFVDDDYRFFLRELYCFCPLHMKKLSQELVIPIDRKKAAEILLDGSHPEHFKVRLAFQKVLSDSLVELAHIIRKAVDDEYKNCPVGLMTMVVPNGWWGADFARITAALAGQANRPAIRPQINCYSDTDYRNLAASVRQPALVRQTLPAGTDIYPEVENYPYTVWSKSAAFTRLQMSMVHMDGCHKLIVNYFDTLGNPLKENEALVEMNEKYKVFFKQLQNIIPEGARAGGVAIPVHSQCVTKHRLEGEGKAGDIRELIPKISAYEYISLLGIPIGFDWGKSPFLLLTGDGILAYSDQELDEMLSRGAVLDKSACEVLIERGYGERIGIKLDQNVCVDDSCIEFFYRSDFCSENAGCSNPIRFGVHFDGWCRKIAFNENTKSMVLSVVKNYCGEDITPLVAAVENEKNERFGIIGFSMHKVNRYFMMNARRREQIKALFEWVGCSKLNAVVCDREYVVPVFVRISEYETVLGIANFSMEIYNDVTITLDKPNLKTVEFLNDEGIWILTDDFTYEAYEDSNNLCLIRTLHPCNMHIYKLSFA